MSSLPEEMHLEILKRLPPHPPVVLARASAVCKVWRRALRDPGFLRELYRTHRRRPITLGFFHNSSSPLPRGFVPAGDHVPVSFSLESIDRLPTWRFADCRHDRVLLHDGWRRFLVWHPVTGEGHCVLMGKLEAEGMPSGDRHASAALICECRDGEADRRAVCSSSPFRVAVVFNHRNWRHIVGIVYSSLTGQWTPSTRLKFTCEFCREPCAVIGSTLYQPIYESLVLAFDTDQRSLTTFKRPSTPNGANIRLLRVNDGMLGVIGVQGSYLDLWAWDGDSWVSRMTIDLTDDPPGLPTTSESHYSMFTTPTKIIGVAEEGDMLFLRTVMGIFMFFLESMELKKVHESGHWMETVYPYAPFYLSAT